MGDMKTVVASISRMQIRYSGWLEVLIRSQHPTRIRRCSFHHVAIEIDAEHVLTWADATLGIRLMAAVQRILRIGAISIVSGGVTISKAPNLGCLPCTSSRIINCIASLPSTSPA